MISDDELNVLAGVKYQKFSNNATKSHFKIGFIEGYKQAVLDAKYDDVAVHKFITMLIDLHEKHAYFQGDNWGVLKREINILQKK